MGKKEHISQDEINEIWRDQWNSNSFREISPEKIFLVVGEKI